MPTDAEIAQKLFRDVRKLPWQDAIPLLAAALSEARAAERERCARAVEDAGGDNEDYHADAIRALANPKGESDER